MWEYRDIPSMIDRGYVSATKHPDADLWVYNYTAKAQYEWVWNDTTMSCRGLILDVRGNVIARPFPKFFSKEQLEYTDLHVPWHEPHTITDKMDGSLGILYWMRGRPCIATRGSFTSPQAQWATAFLQTNFDTSVLDRDLTYLFEIIYPQNRIVVDYGTTEDLFFITAIDRVSGKEHVNPGPFRSVTTLQPDEMDDRPNAEGYVIRFASGFRVKVKYDEYKRLHKIVTGTSNVTVWEWLRDGRNLLELADKVPDEFHKWLMVTHRGLMRDYDGVLKQCIRDYKEYPARKDTAMYFQTCKYPQVLFAMLDKKDVDPYIWRIVKPKRENPFELQARAG